jgi:hypothetical protein
MSDDGNYYDNFHFYDEFPKENVYDDEEERQRRSDQANQSAKEHNEWVSASLEAERVRKEREASDPELEALYNAVINAVDKRSRIEDEFEALRNARFERQQSWSNYFSSWLPSMSAARASDDQELDRRIEEVQERLRTSSKELQDLRAAQIARRKQFNDAWAAVDAGIPPRQAFAQAYAQPYPSQPSQSSTQRFARTTPVAAASAAGGSQSSQSNTQRFARTPPVASAASAAGGSQSSQSDTQRFPRTSPAASAASAAGGSQSSQSNTQRFPRTSPAAAAASAAGGPRPSQSEPIVSQVTSDETVIDLKSRSIVLYNIFHKYGVTIPGTIGILKKEYKKLSLTLHPDKNKGSEEKTLDFQSMSSEVSRLKSELNFVGISSKKSYNKSSKKRFKRSFKKRCKRSYRSSKNKF